ncbi:RusA family crossover junction endodeoxyribonuclease, partial [Escherichia coli]|nr:RusA family crossover junction endodeoxyribonuclease [Escherichia coli]
MSDNRKAGKYPASLCNGVDESDRAYRHNRGRTHVSAEGQAYRDNVARIIKNAMLDIGLAMPVKIRIECHMPDRRRRDLDNLQKAAFDALTKAGFWL